MGGGGAPDLEFDKYCKVGQSPKTVLLQHPRRHHHRTSTARGEKPANSSLRKEEDELVILDKTLKELRFRNYRSISCKNPPSRNLELVHSTKLLNRCSLYQSSQERRPKPHLDSVDERKKIEFSLGSDAPFSFSLLDSICGGGSDEENAEEGINKSKSSSPSNKVAKSVVRFSTTTCSTSTTTSKPAERDLMMENLKFRSHRVRGPANTANTLQEKDDQALRKSLSAKLSLPHSPTRPDHNNNNNNNDGSGGSNNASPKSWFSPFKKMSKSKSHRSVSKSKLSSECNKDTRTTHDLSSSSQMIGENKVVFRKSLLQEFSSTTATASPPVGYMESDGTLPANNQEEDHHHEPQQQKQQVFVPPPCKPGHLQGTLKVEEKHGVPYFMLSLSHTEDVYVAKTWKAEDASLSWAYTFHSIQGGKKSSNASQGGGLMRYSNKNSPIVGQMQVSSHLASDMNDSSQGALIDSMVSEFVLYDILHARKSLASSSSEDSTNPSPGAAAAAAGNDCSDVSTTFSDTSYSNSNSNTTLDSSSVKGKGQGTAAATNATNPSEQQQGGGASNCYTGLDFLSPYPWNPADLHTRFESAAIVIEVPFEKRESLKYRVAGDDSISRQVHFNLLDRSVDEKTTRGSGGVGTNGNNTNRAKVKVVTPIGNHSWPPASTAPGTRGGGGGPSQLLDRWRLGGGCDCGGWDMGCPLIVYSDRMTCCGAVEQQQHFLLRTSDDQPCELFLQGAKEPTPVLTMQHIGKGQYAINFHAQLSALQAFAVYVAILHTREASTSANQEKSRQLMMRCCGDEIKTLIEEVTQDQRKKRGKAAAVAAVGATDTGLQHHHNPHPCYVLDPPFSPIARV